MSRLIYDLLGLSPTFVRWNVVRQVELFQANMPRHYLSGAPERPVADELVFLASEEGDFRYEWLELAIRRHNLPASIIYAPRKLFTAPYQHHLRPYLGADGTTLDSTQAAKRSPEFSRRLARLHRHLELILASLRDHFRMHAILTASVGDTAWLETMGIARSLGIPWIVTEREGVIAPAVMRTYPPVIAKMFPTEVDLMLTWNDAHTEFWHRIGVPRERLCTVGDMKTDFWLSPEVWPTRGEIDPRLTDSKILLTYFSFGEKNNIDNIMYPGTTDSWSDLQSDHYEVLRDVARAYPDVQVVVKGGRKYDVSRYLRDYRGEPIPNIVILGPDVQALDLIARSDLIAGFQTTALIESMFVDVPILYLAWGYPYGKIADDLIPFHKTDAVQWIQSKAEFRASLGAWLATPRPWKVNANTSSSRRTFREEYFSGAGGSVALRSYEKMLQVVAPRKPDRCKSTRPCG